MPDTLGAAIERALPFSEPPWESAVAGIFPSRLRSLVRPANERIGAVRSPWLSIARGYEPLAHGALRAAIRRVMTQPALGVGVKLGLIDRSRLLTASAVLLATPEKLVRGSSVDDAATDLADRTKRSMPVGKASIEPGGKLAEIAGERVFETSAKDGGCCEWHG